MELLTSPQLPKNLEKTISDLARAREKSAKQKYLLDLGESLVMHLCSFVLGEYKAAELVSIDLEKSFLNNSKSVSFGVYLGWLREASKFLNAQQCPSEIHALLHGAHDFEELSKFIRAYEALKKEVEQESEEYHQAISTTLKNNLGKVNFLQFFDIFIQLRNRVAHPHKEVKGKMVSWPFSEAYFDAINPYLEAALNKTISELNKIWEFRQYIVDSNEEGKLILLSEESGEFTELENAQDFQEGVRVVANDANTVLLSDWKWLLRAGEEALAKIKQEEDDLRNKATIQDLQEAIKAALEDGQISLEELNFFESLGKTKMGLSKPEIKQLILEVAKKMEIEDPFPEVDKRFIEVIDQAISTKTYNEFLLKLTGQQYGVDNETFEKVFLERTFALNVDPEAVKKNRVLQFTSEEFVAVQGLMNALKWLMSMGALRKYTKESIFKIKEDSYLFGTKEYWHRTAFGAVEKFVENRLNKLLVDGDLKWDTKQNNWQIGVMTSYAWCTLYPTELATKKILALHVSCYLDGSAAIGYLPDWKDYNNLENYGLLRNVFSDHLISFAQAYSEDLKQHPNLLLWDGLNNYPHRSFTDSMNTMVWFYRYVYEFEQIQFARGSQEIIENPAILIESFDISFNLFKGLFEGVNRDYLNLLNGDYLLKNHEESIRQKLQNLEPLLMEFGLCDAIEAEEEPVQKSEDDVEIEQVEEEETAANDGLKGGFHSGYISRLIKTKVKGYPIVLSFKVQQDYLNNKLDYLIYISCAGYITEVIHRPIEKVLESLKNLSFVNAEFYYERSKFLVRVPINEVNEFDPIPVTNFFLTQLSEACAKSYTAFLELQLNIPKLKDFAEMYATAVTTLNPVLEGMFSNALTRERNWMKGMRFLDYVHSGKGFGHWLGWGLEYREQQMMAGVILHVGDSLKGALVMEQMKQKAAEDNSWEFVMKGEALVNEAEWLLQTTNPVFTSSSDYNRNYKAHHALLNNEKTYWCAAKQDDKQWWQVEFPEAMEVSRLNMKGAPQGKSYVTRFKLMYSVDKKNWQTLTDFEGLSDGFDTLDFTFENPVNAKCLRIVPMEFVGWPGFRIDFFGKKIVPSKIELQSLVPISNEHELAKMVAQFEEKIKAIKLFKGLGF